MRKRKNLEVNIVSSDTSANTVACIIIGRGVAIGGICRLSMGNTLHGV
jgi:hypothetical protein